MEQLMEIRNLRKSFGDKEVVKGINFQVMSGEILCILGPNGAGKSTTIHLMTAALRKDGGEIRYKGQPIGDNLRRYKRSLGIVPQDIALYEELSAEANIRFFVSLYGLSGEKRNRAVDEALAFTGLEDRRKDKVKTFSGGMKRRLNIACAIAHRPEIIIMDEPTVGIDPQSRNHILRSIQELRKNGMSVIYTTHYMEEVEVISDRIIILDHGVILAEGTKESLKEAIANERRYRIEVEENGGVSDKDFFAIEGVRNVKTDGNTIEITSLKGVENLDRIISLLSDNGERIVNITSESASLEMVFLKLTGRKLRD